jgi:hypothetical protein
MKTQKRLNLRYLVEMGSAAALCAAATFARKPLLALTGDSGPLYAAVMLLPVVPIWLMLGAIVRHYQRIDEYQRFQLLRTVSLSAGIALCLGASYAFAARAFVLPPLTVDWTWMIMAACWFAATLLTRARDSAQTA